MAERTTPHHAADDCVPDATDHMEALGYERGQLTDEERIRIHERIQEASGLITQSEDDLPWEHPRKQELKDLGHRVWEIGYEILGAARYVAVDELAQIISDLDEEQPFLVGCDHATEDEITDAAPRRVAERIHERLHARARSEVAPTSAGDTP